MSLALITGGSAGLGAAFADRLAARGHDLLLVARGAEQLSTTAREIASRHGVRVDVLTTDLTERHGLFRLEALLSGPEGLAVDVLVNNAACESGAPFPHADRRDVQSEIDLNITATMRLTHSVLPGMLARGRGVVINVGSISGWLPSAGSSYGPTKAWVAAFTDSLGSVLHGSGVRAMALCPGYLRTGWHGDAQPSRRSPLWSEPERVVDVCLADLDRGRALCVPGPVFRPVVGLLEAPRRTLRALARVTGTSREARYARDDLAPVSVVPASAPSGSVRSGSPAVSAPATPVPASDRALPSPSPGARTTVRTPDPTGAPDLAGTPDRTAAARTTRPGLPDLPARPAQRSSHLPHPVRSPHFVPTSRLTGEARVRAERARRQPTT